MSLRRPPPLRQLSQEAQGHPCTVAQGTTPQTELLLRSRRLQEESDTSLGSLPRPKSIPRRHRHRSQYHAARADTTPSPRTFPTLRCRRMHHRSLAGLLARTLSADTVLEGRSRPARTGCRNRQPALFAGGRLPSPSSPLQRLDAPAAVSLADHGPRSPPNRALAMIALRPQKMPFAHFSSPVYRGCHSSFPWFARKCDDSNTPQFNRCLVGAVSVLRGGLALELSPCARIAPGSDPLSCRKDLVASCNGARCPRRGRHHRALVLHGAPPARRPRRLVAPRRA